MRTDGNGCAGVRSPYAVNDKLLGRLALGPCWMLHRLLSSSNSSLIWLKPLPTVDQRAMHMAFLGSRRVPVACRTPLLLATCAVRLHARLPGGDGQQGDLRPHDILLYPSMYFVRSSLVS